MAGQFDLSALASPPPTDPTQLALWLQTGLKALLASMNLLELEQQIQNIVPAKPFEGMLAYADGTNWNPGSGKGLYQYRSAAWVLLLDAGYSPAQQVPTGTILAYGAAAAPTGFVICDGSSLLRAGTYAALFAVIGTAYGTADGTHFNVPDLRGGFIRGWDHGAGVDPDRAARTAAKTGGATGDNIGSAQADAVQGRTYQSFGTVLVAPGSGGTTVHGEATGGGVGGLQGPVSDGAHGTPRVSSETRPINVNAQYIIKV